MKRYIFLLVSLLMISCTDKLAELEIVEFGARIYDSPEYGMPLSYKAGTFDIEVVSDGEYEAVITEGSEWMHFRNGGTSYAGGAADQSITICFDANRTILRSGKIVLSRLHRKVEIEVSQSGILSEDFSVEHQNLSIGAEGGFLSSKVLTLANPEEIQIDTLYVEKGQGTWLTQIRMENNYLKLNVQENLSDVVRHAVITVSKKGTSMSGKIQVSQAGINTGYVNKSMTELVELAGNTPLRIDRHIKLIDAIVINDNLEGNGAENRNITATIQDLTLADRTLYVSDGAGSVGLKLEFAKGAELLVRRFDHIEVDLYGAVLSYKEDPGRYIVTDIPGTAILKSEAGTESDVSVKQRTIGTIQPSDVYTLVELVDCEIPIRKGPYVPINLKHYCVMNKYPMVIRDKKGDDMHMMVNTTCAWHRNEAMPQGSGTITGIIVHEHCDNFEWDQAKAEELMAGGLGLGYVNDIGDIGPYQIRPVRKSDIRLDSEFENGFSELICEFRYCYGNGDKIESNYFDKVLYDYSETGVPVATLREIVPPGEDENGKALKATMDTKRDWTMIGPYEDGTLTSVEKGNGVVHNGVSAYWFVSTTKEKNSLNEGRVDKDYGSAWSCKNWAYEGGAWQVEFNTEGYSPANAPMSVQFGIINGYGERIGGPVNWIMEYYDDGTGAWREVEKFTVPDFSPNGNKQVWNCPGHKYMSFTLPADVDLWGKTSAKVRLRPYDRTAGMLGSYVGGEIEKLVENSLNYFAVRCNKQ